MARKGLPKKYAKMGFKKGWAAYKRAQRKPATRRKTYTAPKKRKVSTVARKKYYRKARSGGGSMKPVIDGLLVGAAAGFLNGKVPYASGLAALGVGYFRRNATLKTLGGVYIGTELLGGLFGAGGTGGGVR